MLIPHDVLPDDCIYFNSTFVIKALKGQKKEKNVDIADLYCEVRKMRKMSFLLFVLCLDWLFLIGSINVENQRIVICF